MTLTKLLANFEEKEETHSCKIKENILGKLPNFKLKLMEMINIVKNLISVTFE